MCIRDSTGTGDLVIAGDQVQITNAAASENKAIFTSDGAVSLYYDNVKKFETTSAGATITGDTTLTGQLSLADSQKIKLGASNDLEIYHDTSHSYIADTGTGSLKILTNSLSVKNAADNEEMISASENGAVSLCLLYTSPSPRDRG